MLRQIGPSIAGGDGLLGPREGRALVGHLEEEQERELLQLVLVGQPVVAQHVAVGPELLDDAAGVVGHDAGPSPGLVWPVSFRKLSISA